MRVLMISRDAKICEEGSAVSARMVEYGTLFDELHVVVPAKFPISPSTPSSGPKGDFRFPISKNVFAYPVYTRIKLFYLWRAYFICKKILNLKSNLKPKTYNLQPNQWVVTAQDPFETGFVALMISRKFKIPLQLQIHTDFLNPYFKKESLKNRIRVFIAKRILKEAGCLRVVSARVKNSLSNVKCQMSNVAVLPIWTDAEKIESAACAILPKQFSFTIFWVGRLEKEKNPLLAIEAFNIFQKHVPNSGLIIIGDGSEREALKFHVSRFRLHEKVFFVGWQNDVAGYYKTVDVLLVTSQYEGYGLQMVEARIAGIPVVAPDVGVAKEVGAYITDHTLESIVKTLLRFYKKELPKSAEYKYPYKDKEEYLRLYKQSFEQCLSR